MVSAPDIVHPGLRPAPTGQFISFVNPSPRKILLVEDSTHQGTHAVSTLRRCGYEVKWATSGLDALQMARQLQPDLILLDVVMPDLDGLAVCRWLKLHRRTADIPVIMLTVRGEVDDRVAGLRLGADDYLPKPFDIKELQARIDAALRIKTARNQLLTRNAQLETMLEHMATLATTDPLTSLYNRRRFNQVLARECATLQHSERPLACMMIDLDHFKAINDRHGHDGGDLVLVTAARVIATNVRESDVVARYGGEEFAVLLPNSDKQGARILGERIAIALRNEVLELPLGSPRVTASIGVADACDVAPGDGDALVRAADTALFAAKSRGRDRVMVFDPSLARPNADVA